MIRRHSLDGLDLDRVRPGDGLVGHVEVGHLDDLEQRTGRGRELGRLDDDDGANKLLGLLSWFSPSILVAVYTSLLMQHFAANSPGAAGGVAAGQWWLSQGDVGSNFWRWINLACTMALYAFELWIGQEDDIDSGLTGHWKTD